MSRYMHGGQRTTWGVISLLPPCGYQGDKLRLWDLTLNAFSLLSGPMTISSGGWKDSEAEQTAEKDRAICWNEGRGLWFESLRRFWITLGCLMAKVHICLWSQLLFGVVFKSLGAALLRFAYLLSTINAVCKDFISMWRGWDKSPVIVVILIISSKSARALRLHFDQSKVVCFPRSQARFHMTRIYSGRLGFLELSISQGCAICKRGAEWAWLLLEGAQKLEPECTSSSALFLFRCDGTLTKSHLRKELVYLAYISSSQSIIEGYQGKNSRWELRKPACWSTQHHL